LTCPLRFYEVIEGVRTYSYNKRQGQNFKDLESGLAETLRILQRT
jgi:hypothetical protein